MSHQTLVQNCKFSKGKNRIVICQWGHYSLFPFVFSWQYFLLLLSTIHSHNIISPTYPVWLQFPTKLTPLYLSSVLFIKKFHPHNFHSFAFNKKHILSFSWKIIKFKTKVHFEHALMASTICSSMKLEFQQIPANFCIWIWDSRLDSLFTFSSRYT